MLAGQLSGWLLEHYFEQLSFVGFSYGKDMTAGINLVSFNMIYFLKVNNCGAMNFHK